jgi:hypothetical protein
MEMMHQEAQKHINQPPKRLPSEQLNPREQEYGGRKLRKGEGRKTG